MTTPDRDLLVEIHTDVKYLRQSHEEYTKKVDALEKDVVTKSFLTTVLSVFGLLGAGLAGLFDIYRKGAGQ